MTAAMNTGCSTTSNEAKYAGQVKTENKAPSNEPPSAEEMKAEKIMRNDDGIAVYPPKTYMNNHWDLTPGRLVHTNYYSSVCEKNNCSSASTRLFGRKKISGTLRFPWLLGK